jgi:hypothetical protein
VLVVLALAQVHKPVETIHNSVHSQHQQAAALDHQQRAHNLKMVLQVVLVVVLEHLTQQALELVVLLLLLDKAIKAEM